MSPETNGERIVYKKILFSIKEASGNSEQE